MQEATGSTGEAKATGSTGKAKRAPAKAPMKAPTGCRMIPVVAVDGSEWHILAGKTAGDNDVLSLREGRSHEAWMHVADVPGSHVVVRHAAAEGNKAFPPRDVMQTAAGVAVFYSKARGQVATVHVTTCGKVKKKAGAPAGEVFLQPGFKTMKATSLDPAQLRK